LRQITSIQPELTKVNAFRRRFPQRAHREAIDADNFHTQNR
jgi:hypothetical protein